MDKADELKPEEYEIKDLIANDDFLTSVASLRQKWNIPQSGFESNMDRNHWDDEHRDSIQDYLNDIEELRFQYGLSFRWKTALQFYVPSANPLSLRMQSPWEIKYTYEGETIRSRKNVRDLVILTDEAISQDEILDAQRTVKRLASRPKKQLITNIDRDNTVLNLYKQGKTRKQIAEWLNEEYPSQSFNTDSVSKIIKRVLARRTPRTS